LAVIACEDKSQVVRLYLASALQRMPQEDRWDVLAALVNHVEDRGDHNLPLMYWFAAESLVASDASRAMKLAVDAKVEHLLNFMVRRIGSEGSPKSLKIVLDALAAETEPHRQALILRSLNRSLEGRRSVKCPAKWTELYSRLEKAKHSNVRLAADALAITFGDPHALKKTRGMLSNGKLNFKQRKNALKSLLHVHDRKLPATMQALVGDPALTSEVLRGLAAYDDARTPAVILKAYPKFSLSQRRDALATLASRKEYASVLFDAIADGRIKTNHLNADVARQVLNLNDPKLNLRLEKMWGVVRDTPKDKANLIIRYQRQLSNRKKGADDLSHGRAVFAKTCSQCHKLYGSGGAVGPDLTGSNRKDLKYLLSNVVDPSAVMAKEYQPSVIHTEDGRTLTGIVKKKTQAALTIQTGNETVVLPRGEVEEIMLSKKSMMPDDLLKQLKQEEVRALFAYLRGSSQVPMLATEDTLKNFYNGIDLTGWEGNPAVWKVENGEIVGKTAGLKKNTFLKSQLTVGDFRFFVKVKLVKNAGNSGIQFRSEAIADGLVKGYQADIGAGGWGKLYEEHGRELLWKKTADQFVKKGEWNTYEIVAQGDHLRTYLNGKLCVDFHDPKGVKRGIIALQVHSGGPMEIRFKDLQLELLQ